jgi:hypothetical protein
MEKKTISHRELKQFTGDIKDYRTCIYDCMRYTSGIRFMMERAEAYWLIIKIALYFATDSMASACQHDARLKRMQFWRLDVAPDRSAILTARADSSVDPFFQERIEYTDFPLNYVDIWAAYDGEYWTLCLPSEH